MRSDSRWGRPHRFSGDDVVIEVTILVEEHEEHDVHMC